MRLHPRSAGGSPGAGSASTVFLALAVILATLAGSSGCGPVSAPSPKPLGAADTLAAAARDHAIRALTEFDTGKVTILPGGRTLREYTVWTEEKQRSKS